MEELKREYLTREDMTYGKLAEKYGVPLSRLQKQARQEGWTAEKRQLRKTKTKDLRKSEKAAEKQRLRKSVGKRHLQRKRDGSPDENKSAAEDRHGAEDRNSAEERRGAEEEKLQRLLGITDKLLSKLEIAIDELDTHLCKGVVRVKEVEYNNEERPDKPTKEVIREEGHLVAEKTIIDRSGLKAIASVLRDIKELQMLRSEEDRREQEARIANLERRTGGNEGTVTVVLDGSVEEFCC